MIETDDNGSVHECIRCVEEEEAHELLALSRQSTQNEVDPSENQNQQVLGPETGGASGDSEIPDYVEETLC